MRKDELTMEVSSEESSGMNQKKGKDQLTTWKQGEIKKDSMVMDFNTNK